MKHQRLDFAMAEPVSVGRNTQARGAMAHASGAAAEASVSCDYEARGYPIIAQRWRGRGGEIDLIAQDGDGFVFIEVKQSRTFDAAAARISRTQIQRIFNTAEAYADTLPSGSLTEMRFDVALVNGQGEIKIMENALGLY